MKFIITRFDDGPVTGFDMGEFKFIFNNIIIPDENNSRFYGMVFIGISELIDCIFRNKIICNFVLTDSSFRLIFRKDPTGFVKIFYKNKLLAKCTLYEFLQCLLEGITIFLTDSSNKLSADDPVQGDIDMSLSQLRAEIRRLESVA